MEFIDRIYKLTKACKRRILLPEGEEPRVMKAVDFILKKGICAPVLIGSPDKIREFAKDEGVDLKSIEIIDNKKYDISCVSVGNPHAVIFVKDVEGYPVLKAGKKIEVHPIFPERTNVEFVEVLSREKMRVRVWERGTGETLACGSGACAAAVISILKEKVENNVKVLMTGGDLEVYYKNDKIHLTGPAVEVFRGEI